MEDWRAYRNRITKVVPWDTLDDDRENVIIADSMDKDRWKPPPYAAEDGHTSIARELLPRKDAVADSKDKKGQTPSPYAAEKVYHSSLKELSEQNDVVADSTDKNGRTSLSSLAVKEHESTVRELLEWNDAVADSTDGDGWMPLSYNAETGHESVVGISLKQNGVVADSKDKDGHTPLSNAAEGDHSIVMELLEQNDVVADSKDKDYRTPFSNDAEKGHHSSLRELSKNDVVANSKDKNGQPSLSYAAEKVHESSVTVLLKRNDVAADSKDGPTLSSKEHESTVRKSMKWNDVVADSTDGDGRTSLSYAAEEGYGSVVGVLLKQNGVVADSKDKDGRTPLSYAAEKGHYSIVMELLERDDVAADSKDKDDRTPFSYAAERGHHSIVMKLLMQNGIVADSKDKDDRTPLSYAAEKGHYSIVPELLVQIGVVADSKDKDGRTPLSYATEKGNTSIVMKLLMRNGTVADSKDKDGRTPFSYAAEKGHKLIVLELLKRKWKVVADSKDKDGRTPLSYATEKGHHSIVRVLLNWKGIVVVTESKDKYGRTPLSYAAEKGHHSIVMELLAQDGVVADSKDKNRRTPLSYAAEKGHHSIVTELLKQNGIVADSKDKDGRTPLSYAAEKGHGSIIETLLMWDVVPNSMDKNGCTPLWYAKENMHASIITMLSKWDPVQIANAVVNEHGGMPLGQEGFISDLDNKAIFQVTMDSMKPAGIDSIGGKCIVLGAVNALRHLNKHAHDISQFLAQYNIHHGDYIVQSGFNSQLFFNEVGFLEEITVSSAIVPKKDDLVDLLDGLGKIISPFPGLFCKKDDIHPTPIFKEDGEKWDIDAYTSMHTKWSPLLSQADIGSNAIFQQCLQVSSYPLGGHEMSNGSASQTDASKSGRNGDPGSSQKGKGKEKASDWDADDSTRQSNFDYKNVNENNISEDEESPTVHFDVSAGFPTPNQTSSDHSSHMFEIMGTISIPKVEAQSQKLHVRFKQLNFQGLSGSKYTQSSARVAIDAKHPTTRIIVKHPHKSAASTNQETVTSTNETDFDLGGNVLVGVIQFTKKLLVSGMAQGGPSVLISRKGTEATVRTQMLSRITNFRNRGVVWWGFEVDDTNFRQFGIELFGKDLPNVDFEYQGKRPLNLSEHFDIEVAAYWSMPPPNKEWFTSPESVPPYYNLCQVVTLNIPRILEESLYYYEHITADAGPDGKVHIVKGNKDYRDISEQLGGKNHIEDVQDPGSIQQKSLWEVSHLEIPSLQPCPVINQDANDEWTMVESSSSQEQPGRQVESHSLTDLTSRKRS